ncbi:MAG: UvrD/REP helicase [Spirochaetes bacterium]|nr:MAG: UvrD/REP helicase [Spirochaetota bacterium]
MIQPAYLDSLDPDQRTAAVADRSCVVTAGAGAGKTSVLVARYLYLALEKKIPLSSILAITFTRKAAAEMFERIYRALSAERSEWAEHQRSLFPKARIATIDSLCADICRQGCHTLGYSSDFTVDEPRSALLAETIAYRYLGPRTAMPGLSELLASFTFDQVATELLAHIGRNFVSPLALQMPLFSPESASLERYCENLRQSRLQKLGALSASIMRAGKAISNPRADCRAAMFAAERFLKESVPTGPCIDAFAALALRAYGKGEEEQEIKEAAKDSREAAKDLISLAAYEANALSGTKP